MYICVSDKMVKVEASGNVSGYQLRRISTPPQRYCHRTYRDAHTIIILYFL